jgi:hypothetical protein
MEYETKMEIKELFWELTHKNYIVKTKRVNSINLKNTMNITNYWKTKRKTTIYKNAIVSMVVNSMNVSWRKQRGKIQEDEGKEEGKKKLQQVKW